MDNEKIEQEILDKIKKKLDPDKKYREGEIKKIIEREVFSRAYLKKDWQIYYAVERIIKKLIVKESKWRLIFDFTWIFFVLTFILTFLANIFGNSNTTVWPGILLIAISIALIRRFRKRKIK